MQTKTYLGQIRKYDRMIQNKLSDIYRLEAMAVNMSIAPKNDKVQASGSKDILGDSIAKVVDMKNEVVELVDTYYDKRQTIIKQIDDIPNDEYRDVLTQRFVLCRTFDEIPDEVNMSRRKVFYIYGEALEDFERRYGAEYKRL